MFTGTLGQFGPDNAVVVQPPVHVAVDAWEDRPVHQNVEKGAIKQVRATRTGPYPRARRLFPGAKPQREPWGRRPIFSRASTCRFVYDIRNFGQRRCTGLHSSMAVTAGQSRKKDMSTRLPFNPPLRWPKNAGGRHQESDYLLTGVIVTATFSGRRDRHNWAGHGSEAESRLFSNSAARIVAGRLFF